MLCIGTRPSTPAQIALTITLKAVAMPAAVFRALQRHLGRTVPASPARQTQAIAELAAPVVWRRAVERAAQAQRRVRLVTVFAQPAGKADAVSQRAFAMPCTVSGTLFRILFGATLALPAQQTLADTERAEASVAGGAAAVARTGQRNFGAAFLARPAREALAFSQ